LVDGSIPNVGSKSGAGMRNSRKRPSGYWKDWRNVQREAGEIVAHFGTIPSCRVLERHGYTAFVRGVIRHWGSIRRVTRALGVLDGRASNGDWRPGHWTETAFEEAIEQIIKEYGNIPPKHWLARDGYPSTLDRLIRQHGGYQMLRHLHGLPEWEPVYPPWVDNGKRWN